MNEPTETDGSNGAAGSTAASETAESGSESERECPACGDTFEDGAAYRDHLLSVGLVY